MKEEYTNMTCWDFSKRIEVKEKGVCPFDFAFSFEWHDMIDRRNREKILALEACNMGHVDLKNLKHWWKITRTEILDIRENELRRWLEKYKENGVYELKFIMQNPKQLK